MEALMKNKIKLTYDLDKLLEIIFQLKEKSTFDYYYTTSDWLKRKMDNFDIAPTINFLLLKNLKKIKHLFNNLSLSKKKSPN